MTTVLISGFTGYIALHIVKQLLQKGYTVIGTVRSAAKGDKYAKLFNTDKFSFEVVAEIAEANAFDKCFINHPEIETVYHVASPLIFDFKDPEKEILEPALKGTEGMLKSIHQYGSNVTKVIVTSSYSAHSAIYDHYNNNDGIVTEDSVSTITREKALEIGGFAMYWASKRLAEKLAWEFVEKYNPPFQLTCVAPAWCFGPQVFDELAGDVISTLAIISGLFSLKPDSEVEDSPVVAVDVRDIAALHIAAAESPDGMGRSLLLGSQKADNRTFLNLINKFYPEVQVPKVDAPALSDVSCPTVECSKSLKVLGRDLIPLETSIKDTLAQFKLAGVF